MKCITSILLFLAVAVSSYSQPKINSYEYWFDNNYAGKIATNVNPTITYSLNKPIPTAGLPYGLHTFNIRFKDDTKKYSAVESAFFYKIGNQIYGYEYWVDGDYSKKNFRKLDNASAIASINLNIGSVVSTFGVHQFNIRFRDKAGIWSSIKSSYFIKSSRTVIGYEYWIDNDYAKKVSKAIPPSYQTVVLDTTINHNYLSTGLHQFNIRWKGYAGSWSSTAASYFYKGATLVYAYEYWVENDYAHKVFQTVNPPSSTVSLNTTPLFRNNTGNYQIRIRFKGNGGVWSNTLSKSFFQQFLDVDRDGLPNITENAQHGTDTTNLDTNDDLLADGINVFTGLPPLSADTDGDTISNIQEMLTGTNPVLRDTDMDGVPDNIDPFPTNRFRTALPLPDSSDHNAPVITILEPF